MPFSAVLDYVFEAAHRLPLADDESRNLHGHSWTCQLEISADSPTPVDLGREKEVCRTFISTHLDHAALLGASDRLIPALRLDDCRVFRFGADDPVGAERFADDLDWPTPANIAIAVGRTLDAAITAIPRDERTRLTRVQVQETRVSAALWTPTSAPRQRADAAPCFQT